MKRSHVNGSTFFLAWVLGTLLTCGSLMCLNVAFQLNCAFRVLLGASAGLSLLGALFLLVQPGWPLVLGALAVLGALVFWKHAQFWASFQTVLRAITAEYSLAFPKMPLLGQWSGDPLLTLLLLGVPLAGLTTWVIGRGGSALVLLTACLPVFLLCLLVVELAPNFWLILLVGVLLILLLSSGVRENNPQNGSRLAWWLMAPTMILVLSITILWPPADYSPTRWSEQIQQAASRGDTALDLVQSQVVQASSGWNGSLKQVDLGRLGPKRKTGRLALEYEADTEIPYLRGLSLAGYEDNHWLALDHGRYQSYGFDQTPVLSAYPAEERLLVCTQNREPLCYTPYFPGTLPEGALVVDDAYVKNLGRARDYAMTYAQGGMGVIPAGYHLLVYDAYLQIPQELRQPLADFVREHGLGEGSAEQIEAFLRDWGTYNLETPQVPAGEDFVLYFLQESRQGYCVHFASAAVLLLRTVGIPARYVTGYAAGGPAGQWNQVLEDSAHAWVEYYQPDLGWRTLDPTPADWRTWEPQGETEEEKNPAETGEEEEQGPEPKPEERPEEKPEENQQESLPIPAPAEPEKQGHPILWTVLPVLLVLALLVLRRAAVLRMLRRRCTTGHPNRRALTWWRWLLRLLAVRHKEPEEALLCLAEKAKFSQHDLTPEELEQLQTAVEAEIALLRQEPTGKRLWYQYGPVLF